MITYVYNISSHLYSQRVMSTMYVCLYFSLHDKIKLDRHAVGDKDSDDDELIRFFIVSRSPPAA